MVFLPHGQEWGWGRRLVSESREKLAKEIALKVWQVTPNLGLGEKSSPMCSSCALTYEAPTHKGHPEVLKLTHAQGAPPPSLGKLINSEKA